MKNTLIFILLLNTFFASAQQPDSTGMQWLNLEDIQKKYIEKQKPIFIYFYDSENDSCSMQDSILNNPEAYNYANILFYSVKIDIYSKDELTFFDGTTYSNTSESKTIHPLVTSLLGDSIFTPSFLLFDKKATGQLFTGYKNRDDLFSILIFYAEEAYNHVDFATFDKYYKITYPPGQKQVMTRIVTKRLNLEKIFEQIKVHPKKIIVNLYYNYSTSATMQSLSIFNNPKVANYINKNFYFSELNVSTKDTIRILDIDYVNKNESHGYHQLPIEMLQGQMHFPVFLILNEEGKLLFRYYGYQTPEQIEISLTYFAEDKFKTIKLDAYKKTFTTEWFKNEIEKTP